MLLAHQVRTRFHIFLLSIHGLHCRHEARRWMVAAPHSRQTVARHRTLIYEIRPACECENVLHTRARSHCVWSRKVPKVAATRSARARLVTSVGLGSNPAKYRNLPFIDRTEANRPKYRKSQILASEADDSALVYLLRMKNLFVAVIRHTGASASSVAAALLPAWAMPMAGSARLEIRGTAKSQRMVDL